MAEQRKTDAAEPSRASLIAGAVMCALVISVYFPLSSAPGDNTLFGMDYHQLHARRIAFAQTGLASRGSVPAWYPRELMGTPFRANIQNFPFIPSRLALLWLDPLHLFAAGVTLAAVLSALFTFAFSRELGMTPLAAAVAGWTFACAGFFASRVMAGHLPLLEAYPALPLLLWRVEVLFRTDVPGDRRRYAWRLATLALATLCVVLAGHPQLPLYAIVVAGLYLLYRGWRVHRQAVWSGAAAMALGAACGAFALWPMFDLIRRSTRVLPIGQAANDLPFPYGRLMAFLFPWRDGWPEIELGVKGRPFTGYANMAYFWDTVCYVGWAPLLAAAFLSVRWAVRRFGKDVDGGKGNTHRLPAVRWGFFAAAGALALLTALPAVQRVAQALPGTILRSPARQVYVTSFSLALAAGLVADFLSRRAAAASGERRTLIGAILCAVLLGHVLDLAIHDRAFIRMVTLSTERDVAFERKIRQFVGTGRAAIDYTLAVPFNRDIDDVGFFDSIMLAKPYAALMDLSGAPTGLNIQDLFGSQLPPRALASTGTRLVMTAQVLRPDLQLMSGSSPLRTYAVPNPLPRAAFFPWSSVLPVDRDQTHRRLRDPSHDLSGHVMLPADSAPPAPASPADTSLSVPSATAPAAPSSVVTYERPSSDEIVVRVRAAQDGVVRVLESWDPGWKASVNGMPVDVVCADDTFLAVVLPAGKYEVRFTYDTPGAMTGAGISLAAAVLLAALILSAARGPNAASADAGGDYA